MFLSLLLRLSGSACRKESEGKEGEQSFEEKSDGEIRSFSFSQQSGPIFKRSFSEVIFSRVRTVNGQHPEWIRMAPELPQRFFVTTEI